MNWNTFTENAFAFRVSAPLLGTAILVAVILGLVGERVTQVMSGGSASIEAEVSDTHLSQITFESGLQAHMFLSWVHPFKDQRLVVSGTQAASGQERLAGTGKATGASTSAYSA